MHMTYIDKKVVTEIKKKKKANCNEDADKLENKGRGICNKIQQFKLHHNNLLHIKENIYKTDIKHAKKKENTEEIVVYV